MVFMSATCIFVRSGASIGADGAARRGFLRMNVQGNLLPGTAADWGVLRAHVRSYDGFE